MLSRIRMCTVLLVVTLAGVAGCSSSNTEAPSTPSSAPAVPLANSYHSPDGYSISPPDGWVLHPVTGIPGLSSAFLNPTPDTAGQKPFADNLTVIVSPTSDSLDNLITQSKQETASLQKNYKLITDQATVVNGQPAHLLGGTYDQEGIGPVQNIQLSLVSGGKSYAITFTTTAGSFDKLRALGQATLSSFALG